MPTTTKRLTKAEINAIVRGFMKAMNDRDVESVLGYLTDDVVYEQPFTPTMRGKEAVRAEMTQTLEAFKDVHMPAEDVGVFISDDHTSAVITFTMIGTMTGPTLGAAPTGRTMRIKGAQITKFRDGLISEGTFLYDSMEAAEQLGLLPKYDSPMMKLFMAAEMLTTMARKALRI